MRLMIVVCATLFLALAAGCATPGGGQNQNDNANSNGVPPGGGQPNDNNGDDTGSNDNAANDNASNGDGSNDNSDDSGDLPTAFRLDGVWDDGPSHVIVEQNGVEVEANYFSEFICDLDTGPVSAGEDPAPGQCHS